MTRNPTILKPFFKASQSKLKPTNLLISWVEFATVHLIRRLFLMLSYNFYILNKFNPAHNNLSFCIYIPVHKS